VWRLRYAQNVTGHLFCGEALCKKPVAVPAGFTCWPLRCPECGTSLYPADVLARTPVDELVPKRAALMIERSGVRHEARSAELAVTAAAEADATVNQILAMVETGEAAAGPRRARWIGIALVALIIAATVAFLLLR
jgi:hypothetical protein